jgi:hypothetical protein
MKDRQAARLSHKIHKPKKLRGNTQTDSMLISEAFSKFFNKKWANKVIAYVL